MNSGSEGKKDNAFSLILQKIKSKKKLQYLIIAVLAVVLIAVVFSCFDGSVKTEKQENTDVVLAYVDNLENRLEKVLSKVDGAGNVSVVITVSSGMETVLATTTTTKNTANGVEVVETPLIVNGKTVVIKELYPKITGVLIVAEGAKNIAILTKIQQAAVSLLDININQIEILTMK